MVLRSDVPLSSTGSHQVRFPCFTGTMRTLRRLAAPVSPRFVSFARQYHLSPASISFAPASIRTPLPAGQGFLIPVTRSGFEGMETTRPPRFLDDPPHICPAHGPRSSRCARPYGTPMLPSLLLRRRPRRCDCRGSITRLLRSPPTLRARVTLRLRKDGFWLPASFTRWVCFPTGSCKKVSKCYCSFPPSPGLPWREAIIIYDNRRGRKLATTQFKGSPVILQAGNCECFQACHSGLPSRF